MIKQYKLSINPLTDGYLPLELNPLIRAAQLTLDLANLVGGKCINPNNPIIANVLKDISETIERCSFHFEYLDCKEQEIRQAVKAYADAVFDKSNNNQLYDNLIEALVTHIEVSE